eukprot:scaffold16924_cov120-Isochrysis_galbana.AAC.3
MHDGTSEGGMDSDGERQVNVGRVRKRLRCGIEQAVQRCNGEGNGGAPDKSRHPCPRMSSSRRGASRRARPVLAPRSRPVCAFGPAKKRWTVARNREGGACLRRTGPCAAGNSCCSAEQTQREKGISPRQHGAVAARAAVARTRKS